MARAQVITFDFYGTLVQWHEALEIAFREMLVRRGLPASGTAALAGDFAAEGAALARYTTMEALPRGAAR